MTQIDLIRVEQSICQLMSPDVVYYKISLFKQITLDT